MDNQNICNCFKEGSVPETLFIPLYVKAKETGLKNAIIKDYKAVEILEKIQLDASRFDGGNIAHMGIITRTQIMDNIVKSYLKKYPDGTVVNLGAGLDTRITRVDNGKLRWYDLDLPEVIDVRRNFFGECERVKFIPKSIFDSSWISNIAEGREQPMLIIAEGLLMYFDEEKIKEVFRFLIESFPNAEMCFDVVHSYFVGKGISARFLWGIDKASDIEKLCPEITLLESWSVGDFHKNRQGLFSRIFNILPSTRNRSQIIHINFRKRDNV